MQVSKSISMIDTTGLFPGERAALLDLLRSLRPSEWWLPTVCGDWTVHDVTLHLLGADINVLSGDRDRFFGPPSSPTPGDLSDWATLVAFINDRNRVWVEALRRFSPPLVCELLETTGQLLDSFWPSLDLNSAGPPVSWAGSDPAPLWLHVAREYTERWIHQQHIRDATGRPGLTSERWLGPVLETFMLALAHTLRDTPAPDGTALEVCLTGPAGGSWWAVRNGQGWKLNRTRPERIEATVTMAQDTAWRLFTRGIEPADAMNHARSYGDLALGDAVFRMVSIIA